MRTFIFHLLVGALLFSCSSPSHDLLITNVNVIDVVTGEVLPNRTVAINGDEIAAIYTKAIKPREGTAMVDGTGKYLIPGLWDMHVHNNWNYEDTNDLILANGITGAREMWGNMAIKRKMTEERAAGKPIIDIYSAGVLTDGAPRIWPGSAEVTTPEEAEALVRCQVAQGADFIKVYSLLDSACFFTIGKTATELEVPFAGHVPVKVPISDALYKGMLTSEHLYGLESASFSKEQNAILDQLFMERKWREIDKFTEENLDDSLLVAAIEKLNISNHWFSPTMVTLRGYKYMYDSAFTADKRLAYLPEYMIDGWKPRRAMGSQLMMPDPEVLKKGFQIDLRILKALITANAQIIAGTDYPNPWAFPGFSMHDELEIYVQAGMTPLQSLQTATLNPAKVMNNDRIGSVEKGKLASLVLLNSNPLDDINAIRDIESVILRGKIYDRIVLDEMLANAKRKAALPDAMKLMEDLDAGGNLAESLLALENSLDSLAERYHLSMLEMSINRLGYKYLREEDFASAMKVFELNTRLYSHSQNVWDSYAEGFLLQGDTINAIQYYQKALDIYPCNQGVEKRLLTLKP